MKTKLMLASLAMVVLMVAAVGAGTLAYFTDTETVEGNMFVAGTIDISVEDEFTVLEDLKPCETGYLYEEICNDGTNPAHIWKRTVNIVNEGGINSEPEETFCLDQGMDSECSCLWMSNLIRYDLYVDSEEDGGWIVHEEDGYTLTGCQNVLDKWIYLGMLEPTDCMYVVQSYHLDDVLGVEANNAYQGDIVTFDMEFMATQTVGMAPGPTPQLLP